MQTYLTTAEVADYLRLKERKVYDLVRQQAIPCVRVTGKLLFPRHSIDLWLMNHLEGDQSSARPVPVVLAGSQDPLLEWAVRESGSQLALLCQGSGDGVRRLMEGRVMLAGLHLLDATSGEYNRPEALGMGGMRDLVMVRWASRRQGLLLAPGNPLGIRRLTDLVRPEVRVAHRQPDAGAGRLLTWLLDRAGVEASRLRFSEHPSLSEDDLALAIRQGEADAGLGVEAAARRQGLTFLPLHREHFDLAMRRRSYFESPIQRLLSFAQEPRFVERAEALGGYDIGELGRVVHNA
ncbi:helix-turn-helix transcriptional regulator [Halomonas sp. KAO]|uniref:helix-turn-helix transcriptional regulator n=1 Tax=Halomonas sp. KAO TaxID=2783858 RepID=UPI00189FF7E6|nr:helix-turn-helix transcriptional regulator [Halomonas sp. KAO]MBF7053071.1 helix-turn-helix transcriptional regulator [Halomonas sp. KAO]